MGMGWDGMGWEGMGWDGKGRDGRWDRMGWDWMEWIREGSRRHLRETAGRSGIEIPQLIVHPSRLHVSE